MQSWQASTRKKSRHRSNETPSEAVAAVCLKIVDACLLGIIFVAPLFLGGRDAFGRMLFIVLGCTSGVAWLVRQSLLKKKDPWTRSWAMPLAIAAVVLVTMQLVPLPWDWLQQLAPRNSELLPLWQGETSSPAQLGVWNTLSLTPSATKLALATLIAYVLLFIAAVGRLRTIEDIWQLMRLLAVSAIAMSAFGLLQYFTSNGRFFWFYEYPYASTEFPVKGSFTCRNHFANFLVLGLGPLLAWIVIKLHSKPSALRRGSPLSSSISLSVGLTLIVLAILLSISRGGVMALAVVGTLTVVIYYRRGFISSGYLYGLAMLGMLVVGLLSVYGYDAVAGRLDDFASGSIEGLDAGGGRRKIWAANVSAIQQGGLFGSGAGSHQEIYPTYLPQSLEINYTHAENGYLQIPTENGWLGAALLTCAILLIGSWCWRANRHSESQEQLILAGAVTAALAASLVHSLVDFVWYIPACMSLTVLLMASALRLAQLANHQQHQASVSAQFSQFRWLTTAVTASLLAIWAISTAVGPGTAAKHWNKYRLAAATGREHTIKKLVDATQSDTEIQQEDEALTEVMIYHLRNTLACDPSSATAHSLLASKYMLLFEQRQSHSDNAMMISQICQAATSQFASAKELRQWLNTAFGENSQLLYQAHYHARRALKLCPLQGESYLYLSNLSFLQGQSHSTIEAYIDQGLRLRPYDFNVVFHVGEQLSALGRDEEAIDHWRRIFRDPGKHQLRIIQLLSRVMVSPHFLTLFEPDWQTIPYVWQHYRQLGNENDSQIIAQYATGVARRDCPTLPPKESVAVWRSLAGMYKELEHYGGVLFCYQQAYQADPNVYSVRRELGRTFLRVNQYEKAEPHLRWCLTRRPNDENLKAEVLHATKKYVADKSDDALHSEYQ